MERSRQITTKIPSPDATIINRLPILPSYKHFRGQLYSRRILGILKLRTVCLRQNCPTSVARLTQPGLNLHSK